MQRNLQNKRSISLLLCMMLIVAMAFSTMGCSGKNDTESQNQAQNSQNTQLEPTVLGEGKTEFSFLVVDKDGNKTLFEIHTDKEIVGDALLEHNLIAGDDGAYGLYVKTVNGITADYDVDQTYWAFYVNDAYASSGVGSTTITVGDSYSFKVEK